MIAASGEDEANRRAGHAAAVRRPPMSRVDAAVAASRKQRSAPPSPARARAGARGLSPSLRAAAAILAAREAARRGVRRSARSGDRTRDARRLSLESLLARGGCGRARQCFGEGARVPAWHTVIVPVCRGSRREARRQFDVTVTMIGRMVDDVMCRCGVSLYRDVTRCLSRGVPVCALSREMRNTCCE